MRSFDSYTCLPNDETFEYTRCTLIHLLYIYIKDLWIKNTVLSYGWYENMEGNSVVGGKS